MPSRSLPIAIAFLCGTVLMALFSAPFIAPALAQVLSPQQMSDRTVNLDNRLATVEKQLSKIAANNPGGFDPSQLTEQVNALQGTVKNLQAARDQLRSQLVSTEQDVSAEQKTLAALQFQVGANQAALSIITKNNDVTAVRDGLAALKAAYNAHYHKVFASSTYPMQTFDCNSKNNFTGVCAQGPFVQVSLGAQTYYSDVPVKLAP